MRTIEFAIRFTASQEATVNSWLRACCWIYNQALEHRIKSYKRRRESLSLYRQQVLLTKWRSRIARLRAIPVDVERGALRRVHRGMESFFGRCKLGEKPGFPRFRSSHKFRSIEMLRTCRYLRSSTSAFVPGIGLVAICIGNQQVPRLQRAFRIIRRASGWYGQFVIDDAKTIDNLKDYGPVGVDVGLESFATLSNGEKIDSPRFYAKSQKRRTGLQRSVSRKRKGSKNRRKARDKFARHEERVMLQRRNFCHQHSTELARKHPVIAVENLNIKSMVKCRSFSKSISDAGWGIFLQQLKVKAENAGRQVIAVNPSGTSQTCPNCGAVKKKELRERTHSCGCGLVIDRDHAAACVILARALEATGATRLRRDSTSNSMPSHLVKLAQ